MNLLRTVIALLAAACAVLAASSEVADAAERGNWTQVRSLLAAGADVLAVQADGMTALHWAVQANHQEAIAALLAADADPNSASRYGVTPLWLAATNGSAGAVQTLLRAGADPNGKLPHGETALMAAARTGEPETIRTLLNAGADPNAQETSQGETGLMWAAAENHAEAIRILIQGGADPDLPSKALELAPMDWVQVGMVSTPLPRGGWTAAMYAARQDAHDAVLALARSGANLDAQDPDGATALQIAIMNQHYDLAERLLEEGADPNVADRTGMTSLYAAVDMVGFRSDIGRAPRRLLDENSALDVVRLALAHGANPNAQLQRPLLDRHHGFGDRSLSEGATALMRAAKGPDLETMRLLLDAGADATLRMANGSHVLLMLAGTRLGPAPGAADRLVAAVRLLAEHGVNLDAGNNKGETALHIAARLGSNGVVRVLAELGANLGATDQDGKTALDLVSQPGRGAREDTAALLRELMAAQ